MKRRLALPFALTVVVLAIVPSLAAQSYSFKHFAGNPGGLGYADGSTPQQAMFNYPYGVAVSPDGVVFIADQNNFRVRRLDPDGTVSTVLGNGSSAIVIGNGSNGSIGTPTAIAVGPDGMIYLSNNTRIFKLTQSGTLTPFAGGAYSGTADGVGSAASFLGVWGLAVDRSNNVYAADYSACNIRRIAPDGTVTTVAGLARSCSLADGTGTNARFNNPSAIVVAPNGNLYVTDQANDRIREVTPAGVVRTVAGGAAGLVDGTGSAAGFYQPAGITVDSSGTFWISDTYHHAIRKMTPTFAVTTAFGNNTSGFVDGTIASARLRYPVGIAAAPNGDVYVGSQNHAIQRIRGTTITAVTGVSSPSGVVNATGSAARFNMPVGVAADAAGNVYVSEVSNQCVRKITPSGVVTAFAGACSPGVSGYVDANGTAARFNAPIGLRFGPGGNLYVADANNNCIRMITPAGDVTTWSTGGYTRPAELVFDASGNAFVTQDYVIKRVDAVTKAITIFAGSGSAGSVNGTGTAASFDHITGIAIDGSGNLYVSEYYTHDIRKITPAAVVTTIAGTTGSIGFKDGFFGQFWCPSDIAFGPSGDLFVADESNCAIRRVNVSTSYVTTEAGRSIWMGAQDGVGPGAGFNQPAGITFDPSGRMYVADTVNHCIRVGLPLLADTATIDSSAGGMASLRQLDTSPQTATAWTWNVIRRPGGSRVGVSDTAIRNPTFVPDIDDLYVFEADANDGTYGRFSRVEFTGSCVAPPPPSITLTGTNPSCAGSNVTLTASDGYTSYLWSNGAQTKSITVAPTAATTYTVGGYMGACLSNPTSFTQNVFTLDPPTNVTATATAANKVTLSWTASVAAGVHHYIIRRSPKPCGSGVPYTVVGTSSGTSYDDTSVQSGGTYSYYVTATDAATSCESAASTCTNAVAYGTCTTAPTFSGIGSLTTNGCLLRLSWPAASSNCPSSTRVVYNVYRSTNASFVPSTSNQAARCVANTFYDDVTAPSGTNYYIVRAEDGSTYGAGACNSGNEDTNVVRLSGAPAAGVVWSAFYRDTFDAGGRPPSADGYWTASSASWVALSTCRAASSPTSYRFGPASCGANYDPSLSTSLTLGVADPVNGGFVIPSGARLRFNKMIQAELAWDGVALYYGTSPSGPWTYISDQTSVSPYIATGGYTGLANSQGGRRVWTDHSSTSFSETTVNLDALAGQRIWFQWQFTSDSSVNYEGVYLDDVTLESSSTISCATAPYPVSVLSATSRNGETQIDFVTPGVNYASTTVRYLAGTSYPMSPAAGVLAGSWNGAANAHGSILHSALTNGTTYSYSAFVESPSAQTSPIRTVRSRPIDTTGALKWVYNTGATATSSPGIKTGAGGFSFVASNDRAFHSFVNGPAGGNWPATWKPFAMNGPSQSRTLWFEMIVNGVRRQCVAVGSHDGRVYLVEATSGALLWTSAVLGEMVQASPVAISTVYGAPFGLVMVGSRSADGSSNVYGLHPDDGHIVWTYDNSPAVGGDGSPIGIISEAITFDYAPKADGWRRLYFTSRAHPTGSSKTLWCLKFNQSTVSKDWAVSTPGDIDSFALPFNGNVYVGNTRGEIWAIRMSDQSVVWGPVATNDGGVKVGLWPDTVNNRLYFSTTNNLWAIGTDGVIKWQKALASPSTPNRFGDFIYLGAGDGRVYEISNLLAPSASGLVVKSLLLGDPATPGIVGEPTLDRANGLIYVGTDSGSVYAVSIPLP